MKQLLSDSKEGEAMNLVKDIGDYLQTNAYGTVGTNIFLGTLPASPDECITFFFARTTP